MLSTVDMEGKNDNIFQMAPAWKHIQEHFDHNHSRCVSLLKAFVKLFVNLLEITVENR